MQLPPIPAPPRVEMPWEPFELGSVTDLAGIALGVLVFLFTVAVAIRQLMIMHKQTEMMNEQSAAAKRQETIAKEQGAITKRQGEIAELQYQIELEQQAKRPIIRVRVTGQSVNRRMGDEDAPTIITLQMVNRGRASTNGFYWVILLPSSIQHVVTVIDEEDQPIKGTTTYLSDTPEYFERHDGNSNERLFPASPATIARLTVVRELRTREFKILWRAVGDDGPVPGTGYAEIQFKQEEHGDMFHVDHPMPVVVDMPKDQS